MLNSEALEDMIRDLFYGYLDVEIARKADEWLSKRTVAFAILQDMEVMEDIDYNLAADKKPAKNLAHKKSSRKTVQKK